MAKETLSNKIGFYSGYGRLIDPDDIKETVKKLKEPSYENYWQCNLCKNLFPQESRPDICSCGNNLMIGSTKRYFIDMFKEEDRIDEIFGKELTE